MPDHFVANLEADVALLGQLLDAHQAMVAIRAFEELVGAAHRDGRLPGLLHLGIGGEAVAVGVASRLGHEDRVYSSHRPHGHFLALGETPKAVRTAWRAGLSRLAELPNLSVKLSGLGTFTRVCSIETWSPVIEQTIELFGPSRCMFGSNFPIEKLWTTYDELVRVFVACLGGLTPAERQAVLHDTAERVYRLDLETKEENSAAPGSKPS